tara:strand:- start:1461 stop:1778 length:318 start_codon:yes stop_codon:yes gene_type:complete
MNVHLLFLLLLIIATETGAQYFLQKMTKTKKHIFLIVGILLYAAVGGIYYTILNHGKKLAIANSFWNAGTEITVAILGFALFGQTLTKEQIVGLVLVIVGVQLLG